MILPERRFSFSSRRRSRLVIRRFVFLVILVAVSFSIYQYIKNRDSLLGFINRPSRNEVILDLWEKQKYSDLVNYCREILEKKPSDFDALMFLGFASFYEGASRVNLEERLPFIDDSVFYLRKAVIFDSRKMRPQIDYVLGKAYYHKGKFYSDLSVRYLEKSLEQNFTGKDTYEYLGLAYSSLGKKEKSAECFETAAGTNPTDILFSLLGQVYMELERYDRAEEYLLRSNNKTQDRQTEEKNLFLLAQIYENRNDMIKAEECYLAIIENNPAAADAYYRLGVLYETSGDKIRARSEWRKALRADPRHYGARLKLF